MAFLPGTQEKHRYQTCRDEACELPYCRIYKEGRRAGYEAGFIDGVAAGYASGFEDGIAACPGPHGGR
jgi:flagellar biosynthesis/type III secretory pathway protein FliH